MFVDANPALGDVAQKLLGTIDVPFTINRQPDIRSEAIPLTLAGAEIAVIDHTQFPTPIARQCTGLKHVVFLGTGARSYMNPEQLGELGIAVHTIKGYGDTAVAECAVALMWTAARGFARMDREIRAGGWVRSDSLQLTGRTIGLLGFGGIAAEVARLTLGMGMKVLAWNRSPKTFPGVQFIELGRLLAESDVLSIHLLLNEDTKNFLSRERIATMRRIQGFCFALFCSVAIGSAAGAADLIVSAQDGKFVRVDGRATYPQPAPPDSLVVLDASQFPPAVKATVEGLEHTVQGPPQAVAITADGKLAIVAAPTRYDYDGKKELFDNFLQLVDLEATPARLTAKVDVGAHTNGLSINRAGTLLLAAAHGPPAAYGWMRISPSNSTRTLRAPTSSVIRAGNGPAPSEPSACARPIACSISRCDCTPTRFRNWRILWFSASSSIGISWVQPLAPRPPHCRV